MRWFATILAALVAVAALPGAPGGAARAEGAEGTLRLDDREVVLEHAHARTRIRVPELDAPGSAAAEPAAPTLSLALYSGSPSALELRDHASLGLTAYEGRLKGVLVELDPATGAILGGVVLMGEGEAPLVTAFAGDPPRMRMEGFAVEAGRVRGAIVTDGAIEGFHMAGATHPRTYALNVRFDVALTPGPVLLATHDGPAIAESAPGRALAGLLAAADRGDAGSVMAMMPLERQSFFAENRPAIAMFLGGLAGIGGIGEVSRVYEYDTGALAVIPQEGGVTLLSLMRDGERWMIGPP